MPNPAVNPVAAVLMIVHSRVLERSLLPWIICSQMVPVLALAPIFIVVLGAIGLQGLLPKSIISAYLSFFPITIGMVKGFTSPDPMQLDLMRTYNASRAAVLWKEMPVRPLAMTAPAKFVTEPPTSL